MDTQHELAESDSGMDAEAIAKKVRGLLRTHREQKRLTQRELAAKIGLPARTYIDYETGVTSDIKASYFILACFHLEIPPNLVWALIFGTDFQNNPADSMNQADRKEFVEIIQRLLRIIGGPENAK